MLLPLSDLRAWKKLWHVYGSAEDIPPLLERIAANGKDEDAWRSLWNALYHQGDTGTASLAALPHVLRIGFAPEGPRERALLFAAAVIVDAGTARIPAPLAGEWSIAVNAAANASVEMLTAGCRQSLHSPLLALLAMVAGDETIASQLFADLLEVDEEPDVTCAQYFCREYLSIKMHRVGIRFQGHMLSSSFVIVDPLRAALSQLAACAGDVGLAVRIATWTNTLVTCFHWEARFALVDGG